MSFESLLPKLFRCPECDTQLKDVVYGLLAGPPADNEVAGGCEWSDVAPTKVCPLCGWEGALGGRSWSTGITETRIALYESESDGTITAEMTVDIRSMTDDELFDRGKTHLPARFELVHRGFEAQAIDDY
jgi:rubredoxin